MVFLAPNGTPPSSLTLNLFHPGSGDTAPSPVSPKLFHHLPRSRSVSGLAQVPPLQWSFPHLLSPRQPYADLPPKHVHAGSHTISRGFLWDVSLPSLGMLASYRGKGRGGRRGTGREGG